MSVIFGDSLKDTLKNLAQNVAVSLLGGTGSSIGTTSFALSAIPGVGPLLGLGSGGSALSASKRLSGQLDPDTSGLSASIGLDTFTVRQRPRKP